MYRLLIFLPIWLFCFLLRTLIIVIGLFLIPLALILKAYEERPSKFWPDRFGYHWTWNIMRVFDNEEDSILSGEEFTDKPTWFRIFWWSAIRNPANNLRFIPLFSCNIKPEDLKFILKPKGDSKITEKSDVSFELLDDREEGKTIKSFYYLCWQSWFYSNVRFEFYLFGSYRRLWAGHKLYPSSKFKVPEYQKHGAGYGTQFKKVK